MKIEKIKSNFNNSISGLYKIEPEIFSDQRGCFYESWNSKIFNEVIGEKIEFLQDNHSNSIKGVLRGLHYQLNPMAQGKLVSCISGEIFDVAIDLRKDSKTFGEWASLFLNDKNKNQFWIPEGFAHGFLTLSDKATVLYKTTNYWNKDLERILIWNDAKLSIKWPIKKIVDESPLLSKKDKKGNTFDHAVNNFEVF